MEVEASLRWIPERDSLGYQELYGLQDSVLVRHARGRVSRLDVLVQLGMVRDDVRLTWPAGTTKPVGRDLLLANLDDVDVREAVARATGADEALAERLGLFDDDHGPKAWKEPQPKSWKP